MKPMITGSINRLNLKKSFVLLGVLYLTSALFIALLLQIGRQDLSPAVFILATFFFIIANVYLWYVAARVLRSVNHLSIITKKIREGDLNDKANFDQDDEFTNLGNSFNLMIAEFAKHIEERTLRLNQTVEALDDEIKEHREAEKALSKSEILFKQVWDISVDGMRVTDEEGRIIAVNESFCKIVEMTEEQLEGQLFPVIYDESEHAEALEIYAWDLKNNELKTNFEAERILWNKKKVWFEFSNSFVQIEGTGIIVLSVINDITKRKMIELEIQKNEKRYRMLFNNGNDAVFVNHLTADNHFDQFIEVNDVARLRLGYSREEFHRMDLSSTLPERYHTDLEKAKEKLLAVDHVIFEVMQMRKDKRQIPVEISAHLFEFDNRPTVLSIARDITERKIVEKKLKHTSNQLRNLSSRLQDIREEERTMIAREIHDELGQVITVLKIQVSLMANKLHKDQNNLREKIDFVSQTLDQMVDTVQKITSKLRPGILDELGLIAAIDWQAQEFEKRTGIVCDSLILIKDISLDREKSTAIFRIFQEALTNIARHADADKISVILREEEEQLTLEITDNGQGIRKSQIENPRSLGILGMQERALVLGGTVQIRGVAGSGTHVKVAMPLQST